MEFAFLAGHLLMLVPASLRLRVFRTDGKDKANREDWFHVQDQKE